MLEYEKELWGHFLYSIPVHPIYNTMIAYGIAKIMEAVLEMKWTKYYFLAHLYALEEKLHLSTWSEVLLAMSRG